VYRRGESAANASPLAAILGRDRREGIIVTYADSASLLTRTLSTLATIGAPLTWALLAASLALAGTSLTRARPAWRRPAMFAVASLLGAGEVLLLWFHRRLWLVTTFVDPSSGRAGSGIVTPIWIESEKLYLWAVIFAVMALLARRHRAELEPIVGTFLALFAAGAVMVSRPFTEPLPQFVGTVRTYLALAGAPNPGTFATNPRLLAAAQQFEGLRDYYASPFMWVHPPLLFFCYGAFVVSFAAVVLMLRTRRGEFETTAYRWARLGYLPLTAGMLLGFPWAVLAWKGQSWWWSGKVDVSIMMWLLYTAYLHGRLYLRRRGMWRWVAALAVLSFVALVLTYLSTYVVPGIHSVAG
jgi:hypothetical protein